MFYIMQNDIVAAETTATGKLPIPPFEKFSDAEQKVVQLSMNSRAKFTIAKVVATVERQPAKVLLVE